MSEGELTARTARKTIRWAGLLAMSLCAGSACADDPQQLGGEAEATIEDARLARPAWAAQVEAAAAPRLALEVVRTSGCGAAMRPEVHVHEGRVRVAFADYGFKLQPSASSRHVAGCSVVFRVAGARRHRVLTLGLDFVGVAALFSPQAQAQVTTSVTWSGRGPAQAGEKLVLAGGASRQWIDNHSFAFSLPDGACHGGTSDAEEVSVETTLTLFNPDVTRPAEATIYNLLGEVAVAPGAAVPACAPTR